MTLYLGILYIVLLYKLKAFSESALLGPDLIQYKPFVQTLCYLAWDVSERSYISKAFMFC